MIDKNGFFGLIPPRRTQAAAPQPTAPVPTSNPPAPIAPPAPAESQWPLLNALVDRGFEEPQQLSDQDRNTAWDYPADAEIQASKITDRPVASESGDGLSDRLAAGLALMSAAPESEPETAATQISEAVVESVAPSAREPAAPAAPAPALRTLFAAKAQAAVATAPETPVAAPATVEPMAASAENLDSGAVAAPNPSTPVQSSSLKSMFARFSRPASEPAPAPQAEPPEATAPAPAAPRMGFLSQLGRK